MEICGTYDGLQFRPLPSAVIPQFKTEVPVKMIIPDEVLPHRLSLTELDEMVARWRVARAAMPPLDMSIAEMVEEGRER